jgi:hypothetical protein
MASIRDQFHIRMKLLRSGKNLDLSFDYSWCRTDCLDVVVLPEFKSNIDLYKCITEVSKTELLDCAVLVLRCNLEQAKDCFSSHCGYSGRRYV